MEDFNRLNRKTGDFMSTFKHFFDLTRENFEAEKFENAKNAMISAIKSHGRQNFYELLDLLEILVKIEESEGVFWSGNAEIFSKYILDGVSENKDYDYSYYDSRIEILRAYALIKQPKFGLELLNKELAKEITKIVNALMFAVEYFRGMERYFEAMMAQIYFCVLNYRLEELGGVRHESSVVNFAILISDMTKYINDLSDEIDVNESAREFWEDEFDQDPFFETEEIQVLAFEDLERAMCEAQRQALFVRANYLVILAKVGFWNLAETTATEILKNFSFEEEFAEFEKFIELVALGENSFKEAQKEPVFARFPFI